MQHENMPVFISYITFICISFTTAHFARIIICRFCGFFVILAFGILQHSFNVLVWIAVAILRVNEAGDQYSPLYGCYYVSKAGGVEHGAVHWEGPVVKKKVLRKSYETRLQSLYSCSLMKCLG